MPHFRLSNGGEHGDHYTQFSEALYLETDDERRWAEKKLTELRNGYVKTGDEEQFPGNFEWAVQQDRETSRWYIWFHDEESGTPEHVADFVQGSSSGGDRRKPSS